MKILVFSDWYAPAYKAGGPIRSCMNMVSQLKEHSTVLVITSGYDLHSSKPLPGVLLNEYVKLDETITVKYLSRDRFGFKSIKNELLNFNPDYVYLNGLFSVPFTIYVVLAHRILKHPSKIIVATHGVLKPSALKRKRLKKHIFLTLVKLLNIQNKVIFHATNFNEEIEIKKIMGEVKTYTISHFSSPVYRYVSKAEKSRGHLDMIFIGRVHPIKNIDYIMPILMGVKGKIKLRIIGDLEDKEYLNKCRQLLEKCPENIEIKFEGVVPNEMINEQILRSHLFILPTLGENFGHAIIEALSVGRPVLISDQTPWRNLEENRAGWDLPLNNPGLWLEKINQAVDWDQNTFGTWCQGALDYARANTKLEELLAKYKQMFS